MSVLYVHQSLSPGEELVHMGEFHWIYTVQAIMGILWGVVLCVATIVAAIWYQSHYGTGFVSHNWLGVIRELHPAVRLTAFFMFIMGLLNFVKMMIDRSCTEIAITNMRLIYKRGLVARYVGEMNIDRIEGVNVLQTFTGRIFNYGRVMVRGMGVGEVILPPIRNPIAFRRAIERARLS